MKSSMLTLGIVFFGCAAASASDAQYKKCIDATGSNSGWAECGAALIERNESKMEGYLERLQQIAEGNTLGQINTEQSAWEEFRDAACEFYADEEAFGRESQVLSYPVCKADLIGARAEQLRDYLRQIDP